MSDKKVNAKFTNTEDGEITIHGIDEQEVINAVGELNDNGGPADDIMINIGKIKKIDLIDDKDQPIQIVYGNKRNQ